MIMSLAGLQKLLEREGKITVMHIRAERGQDANELEQVRGRLAKLFPRFIFVEAQRAAQENDLYRFWRGMAWASSLIGLIMGLLIVFNTMLVAVLEKTREIGVLAAVGWSRRRILALILSESLLISALGGLAGITLGYFGLQLLVMHPKLQGFVVVAPSLAVLVQQFIIILLIGIGGGFLPAWRALHLNLVDALKE
jgi:putative ABC transport system permease protein